MDGWSPPVFYDDGDRPRGDSPPVDEVDAPSREMYRSDFNILLEFDVLLFMQNIDYRPQAILCRGKLKTIPEEAYQTIKQNIEKKMPIILEKRIPMIPKPIYFVH